MDGSGPPGDFDPCECVWSHELATRRLINMIRQQTDYYCTDNECITEAAKEDSAIFFIGFWFLLAMVLFFLRPKSSVPPTSQKNPFGPSSEPPAPPPAL